MKARQFLNALIDMSGKLKSLTFGGRVYRAYYPLDYAWEPHRQYVEKYLSGQKDVLFVGMNPGPNGMAQAGVPFGDVKCVLEMGISGTVAPPAAQQKPNFVQGFNRQRQERSGARFWPFMFELWLNQENFFRRCFVMNYCPLLFLDENGHNVPLDKILVKDRHFIEPCDAFLVQTIQLIQPKIVVAIGVWVDERMRRAIRKADQDRLLPYKPKGVLMRHPAARMTKQNWRIEVREQLHSGGLDQYGAHFPRIPPPNRRNNSRLR